MNEIEIQVRPAARSDEARIAAFLEDAQRRYVGFGREDLLSLLESPAHACILAESGPMLWGVMIVSARTRPTRADSPERTTWGYLRGLALVNGWRAEVGVPTLMEGMRIALAARDVNLVIAYAAKPWMEIPLARSGFRVVEHIVNYERAYNILSPLPRLRDVTLRYAQADDVAAISDVDKAAFSPLWQMASGDLIEMLVTSEYFIVAEQRGRVVGYVCANVHRRTGQIYRLAVHPDVQGRGIGRLLLTDALTYCRRAGAEHIVLNTQESNVIADRLYRRFGFRPMVPRVPVMVAEIDDIADLEEA